MKRNLNVELLRCVLMYLIVVHHCCYHGPVKDVVLGGISAMTVFAVDTFVFISGYYGIILKPFRVVRFLLQGVFAVLMVGLIAGSFGHEWDFRFSMGWFGNSYLGLMLVSPFVNAAIEFKKRDGLSSLWRSWFAFAGVFFMSWLSRDWFNLRIEGWGGHSFASILFVYVTGRVFRESRIGDRISKKAFGLAFIGCFMVNLCVAWASYRRPEIFGGIRDYNSPFVICMAISCFYLVEGLKIAHLGWVVVVSPSVFMIYLLHDGVCNSFPRQVYGELMGSFYKFCGPISCFMVAGIVFVVCLGVDVVRRSIGSVFSQMKEVE